MPPDRVSYWFIRAPRPCNACRLANARGGAIFRLMVDKTWTEQEQAELNKLAELMIDPEEN